MLSFYLSLVDTAEERILVTHIYEDHKELMKHIAMNYLHNEDLSHDAVHDAMLRIIPWVRRKRETDPDRIKSYVCVTIKSTSIDIYNKEKEQRALATEDEHIEQTRVLGKHSDLEASELMHVIDELPEHYRAVLQLRIQHNLSDKEIAVALGISHATVRKRLERARDKIRQIWRDENV